jgi:hypothetical protein
MLSPLHREVSLRFGLIPNFFLSTPDAPEIIEKLWDFAKSAYLDSPMPALVKERLFVFLSGSAKFAIALSVTADLVGYGHASGDALAARQTSKRSRYSRCRHRGRGRLNQFYEGLGALGSTIDWPVPESDAEDWIFATALMFVEPTKSECALQVLRQALGAKRLEYLLAFLAFIRTAHCWTMVHPELEIEHDASELVA